MSQWTEHVARWKDCQRCPLGKQRGRICIARGTVPCDVLLVGEAPGASEDALGEPFVGPAGHLLDAVVASALRGPEQQTVAAAYTNLVCCFPREAKSRGDNEPEEDEILACRPRLHEFINLARPRLIVAVGRLVEQYLQRLGRVRHVAIVHPAAVLRMPLAQKQMAVQRSVVILRTAVEDMLREPRGEWVDWEVGRANVPAHKRRGIREVYAGADDIPF